MKNLRAHSWAVAAAMLVLAAAATTVRAQDEETAVTLKPGDPAPPLVVDKWVKGEPVKELEKGKVYVLECWATWCGPCIQAIPHVTELQKKYKDKDLVVIGMNIWESDDEAVEPFVKKMGDKMDYRVATDDKEDGGRGKMAETWMAAAGRNGIPCSFIVDREGKIAWIGRPMEMDRPLAEIIEGKFDPEKEAKRAAEEGAQQSKFEAIEKRFGAAMKAEEWDKALAAIDEAVTASPEMADGILPAKVMVLIRKEDYKAAQAAAKELTEGEPGKDQRMLLKIANALLEAKDVKQVADLAISIGEKAVAAEGELAWIGKTMMARGHSAKGDHAKAVEFQTEAMEGAPEQAKEQLQAELDKYKEKAGEAGESKGTAEEKKAGKSKDAGTSDDAKSEKE